MLHEFLTTHREILLTRCREKASLRNGPAAPAEAVNRGIPLFFQQLTDTLRCEAAQGVPVKRAASPNGAVGTAAALHGAELLGLGFTVDQVVHAYGDVCQSVTELYIERGDSLSTDEFRTLNRCLDDAIADAVTAFSRGRDRSLEVKERWRQEGLTNLSTEHRRLVDIAVQSFAAIKTGNIGATGATGALLMHALTEMQALVEALGPELVASPSPKDG